jgi:magnesium transporter
MSVPQLAGLFSVLPHDNVSELMKLLPKEQVERIQSILSEREATASGMMSRDFVTMAKGTRVADALAAIRKSKLEAESISYVYVVSPGSQTLVGVVDLRDLLLADDRLPLDEVMTSPVVTAEADDVQDDLAEMFAKYHFRLIPVVDSQDTILGIIRYNDIMKGVETRIKM